MQHPVATPERVLALLAAVAPVGLDVDFGSDRDGYARLIDTLDSLAWLTVGSVRRYQRHATTDAWEQVTVAGMTFSSPRGFTPLSDRFGLTREEPVARLTRLTVVPPEVPFREKPEVAASPWLNGEPA